ncbi:Signal peptidase I P [Pirellulimonas nuda]|uniref:Signal peptidase I n=1 Tax=Pirellulimonas nuda TaxID=2528009 RepID=A0A518DFK3_9BACT|nr:signal peptidase I [Pirellulimonas nuda]QDU90263.1 Signal peptidase I P [Pirellulimonas nuda]
MAMNLRRVADLLVVSALVLLLVNTFLVTGLLTPVVVQGASMTPTLEPGRRAWIDRRWAGVPPQRGQVIVLQCPNDAGQLCVKRVLGLPGETVEITRDGPRVDGQAIDWMPALRPRPGDWVRWKLGPDELFVVGDNWAQSRDSRNGPRPGIPLRLVVGAAIGVR